MKRKKASPERMAFFGVGGSPERVVTEQIGRNEGNYNQLGSRHTKKYIN